MTFEEVYQKQFPAVRKFVMNRIQNDADADDITQEVFIRFSGNMHRVEERHDAYLGYLKVTAKFEIGRFYQAKKSRIDASFEILVHPAVEHHFPESDRRVLCRKIKRLKAKQQQAIWLYYFEDVGAPTIAKRMNTAVSNADFHVKQGIKNLRKEFNVR